MAQGAYCYQIGCTVYTSTVPVTGNSVWVWGPSPYITYSIKNFCQYFPQSGFTVPGFCQTQPTQPPTLPPPNPNPPPPPPPPGTGVPVETPPPSPPISGDHETAPPETVPPDLCGKTGVPSAAAMLRDYGFSMEEHLQVPHIGVFTPINKFRNATPIQQNDGLVAKNQPVITKPSRIEIVDGKLQVYHNATGPGYLIFHSPDLNEISLWGSGQTTAKSRWPTNIAASILLIHSGVREDSSTGDVAAQKLAFGIPSKTRDYPKNGFVFDHDGTSGAPQLYLRETNATGDLSTSCVGTFNIRTKLDVLCNANFQGDVDIDGSLTVGGSPVGSEWTTITANTVDATPVTSALVDDFSAEGAYTIIAEVIAYDQLNQTSLHQTFRHGFTQAGGTNDMVSVGIMDDDLMDEAGFTTTGVSFTTNGVSTVTASFQGPESDVCWTLRYRILYQGLC